MKRRRMLLIGALAAAAFGLALAGCSQNKLTTDDLIEMGYVNKVTFDLMGGKSGEQDVLVQYVKDNSLVVEPGSSTLAGAVPTRSGYTFGGYCVGTEDADGNVTYGETWDFTKDRVTSDITLYVIWLSNYTIKVHYGENYAQTYVVPVSQSASGEVQAVKSITISGQTVLDDEAFYLSAEDAASKTNAIAFPYTPSDLSQENTVSELWANTLEGVWRLVKTAEDFTVYNNTNIYLLNDIDFGGKELSFPETYSGTFAGNGHTLSNFKVTQEIGYSRTQSYGLFRELRSTAVIRDVTFKDVTFVAMLTNRTTNEYRAGVLAGYAASAARVQNVTIEGGSFTFVIADKFYENLDVNLLVGGNAEAGVVDAASMISYSTQVRKLTEDEWDSEQTVNEGTN